MFLETVCIKNNVPQHINAHLQRMRETARHYGFQAPELPDLTAHIPMELRDKKVKCSITYREEILQITFTDYVAKKINSLKLVDSDVQYAFKFSDRSVLNDLLQKKGICDEILIVQDNCITDTTISNVVFKKGTDFFTSDTFLLNGVKRRRLLQENKIKEMRITTDILYNFESVFFINAMLDIENQRGVPIGNIL